MLRQWLVDLRIRWIHFVLGIAERVGLFYLGALTRAGLANTEPAAAAAMAIGCVRHVRGRFDEALPYLDHAVRILQHPGTDIDKYLHSVYWCALAFSSVGRNSDALQLLEEAIVLSRQRDERPPRLAQIEDQLGEAYCAMGLFERARPILQDALDHRCRLHGRESRWVVESLVRLGGRLELAAGNVAAAKHALREAQDIVRICGGTFWAEAASYSVAMLTGHVASEEGSYREALDAFESALAVVRRMQVPKDGRIVEASLASAKMLFALERHRDVMERLDTLENEVGADGLRARANDEADVFILYAYAAAAAGVAVPLELLHRAVIAKAASVRGEFSYASEARRLELADAVWIPMRELITLAASQQQELDHGELMSIYELVIEFKGIVADSLAISRERRLATFHPELRGDLDRLAEIRRSLQVTFAGVFQGVPRTAQEAAASTLRREQAQLEATLRARAPELAEHDAVPSVADLAAGLGPNTVLLDFVRINFNNSDDDDGFAVFVLPAGRSDLLRMAKLEGLAAIRRAVNRLRSGLLRQVEAGGASIAPDFGPLWRLVWTPIEQALDALRQSGIRCHRILVSPDDALTMLPFQVLRDPEWESDEFLADRYLFEHVTSARAFRSGIPTSDAGPPLAIGLNRFDQPGQSRDGTRHLDNDLSETSIFPPLALAEDEARFVAVRIGGEAWTGHEVEKEAILRRLGHVDVARQPGIYRSPWLLHVATHGFSLGAPIADEEDEQQESASQSLLRRSGIALRNAEDWARIVQSGDLPASHAGIIDAFEVSGLDLRDTALTVLSSCDSGLGAVRAGEGVFGLQRAFMISGTRGLIMTLWAVADRPMRLMMEEFYDRLVRGCDSNEALRGAQAVVRGRYPWPAAWGGVVAIGEACVMPRSLQGGPSHFER